MSLGRRIIFTAVVLSAGLGMLARADSTPPAADGGGTSTNAPSADAIRIIPHLSPNFGIRPYTPDASSSAAPAPAASTPAAAPAATPASAPAAAPVAAPIPMRVKPSVPLLISLRPPSAEPAAAPAKTPPWEAVQTPPSVMETNQPLVNFDRLIPGQPAQPAQTPPASTAWTPPSNGANGSAPLNYPIHVGDTLLVTMADEPSFDTKAVVQNSGTITLPYIKEINVAGKTLQDANTEIVQRLTEFYVNPSINIDVVQYRKKEFVILGQVTNPGLYSFAPEEDSISLIEAIAKAGGVKQYGDMGHVTVKRMVDGKEQIILVNAREAKALSRNQEGLNFQVLPGDSIVVTLFRNEINLLGQVRRPGIYTLPPLLDSIDLIEAIALAGGTVDERDLGIVHVKREVDGKATTINVDAKSIGRNQADASFPVYAGDTLIVETSNNEFIILGQVNHPGSFEVPPFHDSVDLIEAIAMAGGATRLADTTHITIRRTVDGKTVVIKANAQKLSRSEDNEHVDVLPGDRIVISERIF